MLSSKQRNFLFARAAALNPTVMVGKEGISEGVIQALKTELGIKELVKLRFIASKEERRSLSEALARASESELIRVIGNVAIFYKQALHVEDRTILLP